MSPDQPMDETDSELRKIAETGDREAVTTRFIERHGGEILAFLVMRLRNDAAASEVFSVFTEDFWRGLEGFRWQTTLRSWAYTLARNAANRYQKSQRRREAPLAHPQRTPDCPQRPRTSTAPYQRTEVKMRMRELRRRLPVDDQSLLVLRIDKGLSWNELAAVLSGEGDDMTEAEKARWAARLRQRFASVKRKLKELAHQEGIL